MASEKISCILSAALICKISSLDKDKNSIKNCAQFLIEFLSLSREDILQIKAADKMQDIFSDAKKKYRCLVIKFHLFFLVLFIFNFGFWYLVACFCAVYKNTQMPLIKDTVVSFVLGLFITFF